MFNELNVLTTAATARRLRVTSQWLTGEAESGRLPGVKTDKGWLFHLPTVLRLLEERAAHGDGYERGPKNAPAGGAP